MIEKKKRKICYLNEEVDLRACSIIKFVVIKIPNKFSELERIRYSGICEAFTWHLSTNSKRKSMRPTKVNLFTFGNGTIINKTIRCNNIT